MAGLDRRTIPVPFGHLVYVISDLSLSPSSDPNARSLRDFHNLLGDIDGPAVVIVAGNLFDPDPTTDLGRFVAATLAALAPLRDEMANFCAHAGHQLVVVPGSDDGALRDHARARAQLEELGLVFASDVVLQVASAEGTRDLAVAAGGYPLDVAPVDANDRADADRLEDPHALRRFVASRVLYRRLGAWVWLPVLVVALVDLASGVAALLGHVTHRRFTQHLVHPGSVWVGAFYTLVGVAVVETAVAALAGVIVRRRFNRRARTNEPDDPSEPLALTHVGGVDALEFARRVIERGGIGAIVGGAPAPALAFLDRGVCGACGPSRVVWIEHHGRFGLPPVFTSAERLGLIEIEAARAVQVRLFAGQSNRRRSTILERLVTGASVQPTVSSATSTVGSWPSGRPFPLAVERQLLQSHQRVVRRWLSAAILLDGVLNVVVTAIRPLRSHLHLVLTILPLEVAKSAAALTAVAGLAMIMLARGIRRGQRQSWFLASALLAITVVAHALRGGTVVSLLIALALLAALVGERRCFQATSDRSSVKDALPRLAATGAVTVIAATLGVEADARHHLPNLGVVVMACVERLVGQDAIALPDRVGDFINPSLLAIGVSLIVTTLYFLTRPVVDRRLSSAGGTRERRLSELRAREIVRRHGRGTLDYFALRDDKQFFFFRDSLVAYAVYGGVALVSPDPVGPETERTEVLDAFREFADSRGWTIGVMAAGEEWLGVYHAAGMHYLYLGDEAIVNCQTFSLAGQKMKGLRQACTRLERHGYRVEFLDPAHIEPGRVSDIVELISRLRRGGGERGFSMMLGRLFDPKDKGLLLTVVSGPDGRPAAVCQFVPAPGMNGYSLDLMRRDPGEHPNGLIDFALCQTIEHLRAQGRSGLSLNFAAFRSVIEGEKDTTFTRVERWAIKRLSGILPIESLWAFNSKFHPNWLPRHLVYPAAESFVPVVAATLRAESLTEIPVLGRFLANDPSNRPATIVPDEVLAAAREVDEAATR